MKNTNLRPTLVTVNESLLNNGAFQLSSLRDYQNLAALRYTFDISSGFQDPRGSPRLFVPNSGTPVTW